jgi:uncharacterized membrane protein
MMTATHTVEYRTKGLGLFGWAFLILLVLKLNPGGHLDSPVQDASWWWVTLPLWGLFAVLFVIAVVGALVVGAISVVESVQHKRARKKRLKIEAKRREERRKQNEAERLARSEHIREIVRKPKD